MSQEKNRRLAQQLLSEMGKGSDAEAISMLFSVDARFEIAGEVGLLPWLGRKTGRKAVADFVRDTRTLIERIRFDVHEILASDARAVAVGELASRIKATGKILTSEFALILTFSNGEIKSFTLLEDSFALSQAARP
jgi:ketosteroid isomerase-like protein